MLIDSMENARARSALVRQNRSLVNRREVTLDECSESYFIMNRMTLEHINIGDTSSFRWFRYRQRSFRTLSVSTNDANENSYVPPHTLQRCQSINIDLCISTAPFYCSSKKMFRRAKNASKANIMISYSDRPPKPEYCRKVKSCLRTLSSSCQEFELDFDPFEQAPDEYTLSIIRGAIRASKSMKHLTVSASILNGFDVIEESSKQWLNLETLKLCLLPIRKKVPSDIEHFEESDECSSFWEVLARQNHLSKLELYFTDNYEFDFDYKRLFAILNTIKTMEKFKILFNINKKQTIDFLKALRNANTTVKLLDVCFLNWYWDPSDDEEQLSLLCEVFNSKLPPVEKLARVLFRKLKFEKNYDSTTGEYQLVVFESQAKKDKLFPVQFLDLESHLKKFNLNLCITDEESSDILAFLSEKLSKQLQLEKLNLELCFGDTMAQTAIELVNLLGTLIGSLQNLKDLRLTINTCTTKSIFNQQLIVQVALGISKLRNIRHLKLSIRTGMNGEISIIPIVQSIKQSKNLEILDFTLNLHSIAECEVESLLAFLPSFEHLSTLELDLWPERLTKSLSEKLPDLVNQLRSADVICMNLKSKDKPLNVKESRDLLENLRKAIVHQQVIQSFRVLTTSTQGAYLSLLGGLKYPNNWE